MTKALLIALFLSPLAFAATNPDIDRCLKTWGKQPFGNGEEFRTLKGEVKIVGIGENLKDVDVTKKPSLILVKPSVTVMSKQLIELTNPNGWYCLKGPVSVMGKAQINLHCKAHMATTEGVTVAGSNSDKGGVAVLGAIEVKRVGCEEPTEVKVEKK